MKRRYGFLLLLAILMLVLIDQGSKLWVNGMEAPIVHPTVETGDVHIHPDLNDEDIRELTPIAEALSLDVRWVLFGRALLLTAELLLVFLIMLGAPYYLLWDVPHPRRGGNLCAMLGGALFGLSVAAHICSSWLDALLWGGSLDWIAVVRHADPIAVLPGHNHGGTAYHCQIWDIKDIYLVLSVLMVFIYFICLIVTLLRQPKEIRQGYDEKCKHPIRNLRAMREARRGVVKPAGAIEPNQPSNEV